MNSFNAVLDLAGMNDWMIESNLLFSSHLILIPARPADYIYPISQMIFQYGFAEMNGIYHLVQFSIWKYDHSDWCVWFIILSSFIIGLLVRIPFNVQLAFQSTKTVCFGDENLPEKHFKKKVYFLIPKRLVHFNAFQPIYDSQLHRPLSFNSTFILIIVLILKWNLNFQPMII